MLLASLRFGYPAFIFLSYACLTLAQTANWTYAGCYTDSTGARTLKDATTGSNDMTNTLCVNFCGDRGFAYAGTEYSRECWCGRTLSGSTLKPASDCNMGCSGNPDEACGGPDRLTLYNNTAVMPTGPPWVNPGVNGYQSLGCYTDNSGAGGRALDVEVSGTFPGGYQNSTVANCVTACSARNYIYAGLEYYGECWCGNTIKNQAAEASDPSTCNTVCNGNKTETCGGPNRLNMYTNVSLPSSSTSSISISTVQLSSIVSSSVVVTSSTPVVVASSTSAGPSISGVPTPLPSGWYYKGCWVDNANGRVFTNQLQDANDMTVESCIGNCMTSGFGVAGIEYANQCFCGNFLQNAATTAPQSECNMACAGNNNEFCGAGNRLSVYSNSTANITVYQIPTVQTTDLPTNWKYEGCIRDDAPGGLRALPYQLILDNTNSANNCISKCSAFGYTKGGMEYGNECYCGDLGDIQTAQATSVPESDCNFVCSGDPTTICGGPRRLSLYTWTGPNPAAWNYASGNAAGAYQFLIGGVVVPLITQPARNGKITFLEKSGTGPPNSTGAYELDVTQVNNFTGAWRPMHVKTDVFCSASLTLPDKAGRQLNVGGWALDATYGVRLYWPDGSLGVWGKNDWEENVNVLKLQNGRWYPTAMIMANGTILVVGGQEGSNGAPIPTLEILPTQGPVIFAEYLQRTDPNNLYPYLAVLPSGGIFIQYYNEAAILDEVTLQVKRQLPKVPASVNRPDGGRTYPNEGTAVLLPQYAPYSDPLEVLICGGSTPYQGSALDNCVTIAPDVPNANWTLERMPSKRVLSCIAALPDGTYLIINGAHQGQAGFGLATDPNLNAVLYDPSRPLYNRFTVLANTTVARMYHSEAVLMDDGRVLISGSDPEDDRFPQEYKVEVFIPPYLMDNPVQPVVTISTAQSDWAYGGLYTFTVNQPITKVSLLGAVGSTHGNSMGQRTLFPAFVCSGNSCTVTAPPDAHTCPPGWFQLFALNAQGVPSKAVWVRIGGDPAALGNWPPVGGFKLPGL
ncbi:copper radical oxidase [Bimuria novae-zelandiae CBS 107.79]|uniref:Copper radical oxidase n=1 Tax=Bimuria novae-zelandiae CBS 107.79 TaxID=1447943 RepID=A0A6A5UM56_9PLEO|nr:copper radical oxidase [Bimuria novae-zelandiae CBS 107.79]